MPASEAAAHVNRTIDFLIAGRNTTKESQRSNYLYLTTGPGHDCADGSTRPGRLAWLMRSSPFSATVKWSATTSSNTSSTTSPFSPRWPSSWTQPDGLQAAEGLVLALRKANSIVMTKDELRTALVALCGRLDAAGSVRVAEAMTAAVRDPKTTMLARTVFADAFALIADRAHAGAGCFRSKVRWSIHSSLIYSSYTWAMRSPESIMGYVGKHWGRSADAPARPVRLASPKSFSNILEIHKLQYQALEQLTPALVMVCAELPRQESSSRVTPNHGRAGFPLERQDGASGPGVDRRGIGGRVAASGPRRRHRSAAGR